MRHQYSKGAATGDLDSQPVMIAMKKSMPAKFPKKEMNQILRTSKRLTRRCRNAVVMNLGTLSFVALEVFNGKYHDITGE